MVIGLRARCERARLVELHQGFTFIMRAGQTGFSPAAREKYSACLCIRKFTPLVGEINASHRVAFIGTASRLPEESLIRKNW